jgi:hypothetical protein
MCRPFVALTAGSKGRRYIRNGTLGATPAACLGASHRPPQISNAGRAEFEARLAPRLGWPGGAFSGCQLRFEAKERAVLAPIWPQFAFVWHQKCARFSHSTTYKSFVCTKTMSSFRQNTSFSYFRALFLRRVHSYCHATPPSGAFRELPGLSSDNQYRLPQAGCRVKKKAQEQEVRYQAARAYVPTAVVGMYAPFGIRERRHAKGRHVCATRDRPPAEARRVAHTSRRLEAVKK